MSSKIGKMLPQPVKRTLIKLQYVPEKIGNKIYRAAAQGKIPFPDKAFQKWDYRIHTGRKLNMDDPVTYQEKLQWLKYNYHDPLYTTLVDKLAVRDWVSIKGGGHILCHYWVFMPVSLK